MTDKMTDKMTENVQLSKKELTTDRVFAIEICEIEPNPFQPRQEIAEEKIEELANSIKASGLIQPIVVRRIGNRYQLVVGERRYLACKKLGWQKISAAVKTLTDNDMATIALIENLQRENLNYLEEALGYVSLMKNFNITQEMLAQRLGKSQSTIANKIRLLKLGEPIRRMLLDYGLTERHARALLRMNSEAEQLKMIDEITEKGLTVNQAEKRIARVTGRKVEGENKKKKKPIIRDMRIVLNTIREAVKIMQKSGLNPDVDETIDDEYIEVTIRFTKDMVKTSTVRDNKISS
ncbi:MAG: nucleoid occlusion protein [Bacillota bacterium]|nr:nucleoid occlusion protein [Bacillota bacterium]